MKENYVVNFENGKITNPEILRENKWLMFLAISDTKFYNPERMSKIADRTGHETLNYVLKTLEIFNRDDMNGIYAANKHYEKIRYYIAQVLKWSEVSKCGPEIYRKQWKEKGYNLAIHNEASAEIYREYSTDNAIDTEIIYRLIKTHGLIGQYIRGEVSLSDNYLLTDMVNRGLIKPTNLKELLICLNKCIISAVSPILYASIKKEVEIAIDDIIYGRYNTKRQEPTERMQRMLPKVFKKSEPINPEHINLFRDVFKTYQMWYINSAIGNFTANEICTMFKLILKTPGINKVTNISFKQLLDSLFYDYNGSKKENVYKKRIIEYYLKTLSNEHISLNVTIEGNTALVNFEFQPACEKLIDFCVEAEKANLVSYNESITMLFDQFGFRRDSLDRLNNEDSYLSTMNAAEESTKSEIPFFVTGNTIVDVGSGGGVMLDSLEKKLPGKKIIGTDISQNVIETLTKKKEGEGHKWNVMKHNFVDGELPEKASTIIFSSIIHEIFSFTEINGEKFSKESVKLALKHAYDSLEEGGRIIIRDGVKTNSDKIIKLIPEAPDMRTFFLRYLESFKGLPEIDRSNIDVQYEYIQAPINYIREFLFTYTWGAESFPYEVLEQFGYMTLDEYKEFITNELNGTIIRADEFLEPGYEEHLHGKYKLYDKDDTKLELPNSNLFIVIQK